MGKPYGETRYTWGTTPTDRRFTGQRSEEATLGSLYDYGARMYSPVLARFLSADTMVPSPGNPQSLNRYSYTLNNPVKYTDPTGHYVFEEDPSDPWIYSDPKVRSKQYYTHPEYKQGEITDAQFVAAVTSPIWVPAMAVGGEVVAEGIGAAGAAGWEALGQSAKLLAAKCITNRLCASIVFGIELRWTIRSVNPTSGAMNCLNCAVATDATLAGRPASALGGGPYSPQILRWNYPADSIDQAFSSPMTSGTIIQQLDAAGPGARGIVLGSRGIGQVGHAFNAVNRGGIVFLADGQTGGIHPLTYLNNFVKFWFLRTN